MKCINLDGLPLSQVKAHASNPNLHSKQRLYAKEKAKAMEARLDGKINQALSLERRCENLYQSMPKELRW